MAILQEDFGILNGETIQLYSLSNLKGTTVKITNYGGIITSWTILNSTGSLSQLVLGFDTLTDYLNQHYYVGAIIGRYANLIEKATFELEGGIYHLTQNHQQHHLHGGSAGFDKKIWAAEPDSQNNALSLSTLSAAGEEGYPGNLSVTVTYQLTENDELIIAYHCTTDQTTVVNLTNHSYFNLNDNFEQNILNHELLIYADFYTPVNEYKITTGAIAEVKGTPFDFTNKHTIGARIAAAKGYNHNYVLRGSNEYRLSAMLSEPKSRKQLEVYTSEPGLQLYTGNSLQGDAIDRSGVKIDQYRGLCLETQKFPNGVNHVHFPLSILHPGERYQSKTKYKIKLRV